MKWFRFMDMHSGGGRKTEWDQIYVEAETEDDACAIFEKRTGRDPNHTTCKCCGGDYSISGSTTLEQATGYDRGCDYVGDAYVERPGRWHKAVVSLADYEAKPDVLVIRREAA